VNLMTVQAYQILLVMAADFTATAANYSALTPKMIKPCGVHNAAVLVGHGTKEQDDEN